MHEHIVIARKQSSDPAQEHLRQHKDIWNKGTSAFIKRVKEFTTNLVAFKRALNGGPVPRLGIEKSNIKFPLSPAIVGMLDNLSGEYQSLAQEYQGISQGAKSIISEQEQYSRTRRRSRSEMGIPAKPQEITQQPPANDNSAIPVAANAEYGLVKDGSSVLSRLLTYVKTPFMFGDEDRHARRDMLKSSAELHRLLGEIGKGLLSRDKDAIPSSVYSMQQFMAKFTSEITGPLLALNESKQDQSQPKSDEKNDQLGRFPITVEFRLTQGWDGIKKKIDKLIGELGQSSASEMVTIPNVNAQFLRLEYRFNDEKSRELAKNILASEGTGLLVSAVSISTRRKQLEDSAGKQTKIETKPIEAVKPDKVEKPEKPEKAEKKFVEEKKDEKKEAIPDLELKPQLPLQEEPPEGLPDWLAEEPEDQVQKPEAPEAAVKTPDVPEADDKLATVNQWLDEVRNFKIPENLQLFIVRGKNDSKNKEMWVEIDERVYDSFAQMETTLSEMVRDFSGTDKEYKNIYLQYSVLKKEWLSLLETIKRVDQLAKAGEISPELQKFAQARVSRWLNKQWLSVLRTKDYRTRLAADKYVTATGQALDKFMDLLQQKKVSVSLLMTQLVLVAEGLNNLIESMISLAEMHNSQARVEHLKAKSRKNVSSMNLINEQTINKLKRMRQELSGLKPSDKPEEEEAS